MNILYEIPIICYCTLYIIICYCAHTECNASHLAMEMEMEKEKMEELAKKRFVKTC